MKPTLPPAIANRDAVPADCPLTVNELNAIRALADGKTYKQIAFDTGRTVSTVRTQLHTAYCRLGVRDRAQAVIVCERAGWLENVLPEHRKRADQVTHTQQLYLDAFQRWLRSNSDEDHLEMRVLARIVKREGARTTALRVQMIEARRQVPQSLIDDLVR